MEGKLATQRSKEESCEVVCESVLGLGLPDGLQELLIEQICGQQQRNPALHAIPQEAHAMSPVDPCRGRDSGQEGMSAEDSVFQTLRAQRLKKNQSRLKFSVSIENFNLA